MVSKKLSLFDIEGTEPPKEKLPTLRQFVKELNKDATGELLYGVRTIWLPGTWDNYSVETTAFRATISPGHGLYKALDESVIRFLDTETELLLQVVDVSTLTIRFVQATNFGKWKRLGNAGVRFTPD